MNSKNKINGGKQTETANNIIDKLTNLYKDPLTASIREYVSNAVAAQKEANSRCPVELTLDIFEAEKENKIIVRDFGQGLSANNIQDIFIKFENSAKRESNDIVGDISIGSISALAVCDSLLIDSWCKNLHNRIRIDKTPTGLSSTILIQDEVDNFSPSGTRIEYYPDNAFIEYRPDNAFTVDGEDHKESKEYNIIRRIGITLGGWSKSEVSVQPIETNIDIKTDVISSNEITQVPISDILNNYRIPDTWVEYEHGYVINHKWFRHESIFYRFESGKFLIIEGVLYEILETKIFNDEQKHNEDIKEGPIYDFTNGYGFIALKCDKQSASLSSSREFINLDVDENTKLNVIDTFHALNVDLIEKLYDIKSIDSQQNQTNTQLFTTLDNAGFPIYKIGLPNWRNYVGDIKWNNSRHFPQFKTLKGVWKKYDVYNNVFYRANLDRAEYFAPWSSRINIILYNNDISKFESNNCLSEMLIRINETINDNLVRDEFDQFVKESNIREFLYTDHFVFLIIQKGKDNFDEFPEQYVGTVIEYDDILEANRLSYATDSEFVMGRLKEIYKDPLTASIREYVTNAVDANKDAGSDIPVELTLDIFDNDKDNKIVIRDYGDGLNSLDIDAIFINFKKSIRRGSDDIIGNLCIGSKSGLAVSDSLLIDSWCNNLHNRIRLDKTATGIASTFLIQDEVDNLTPAGTRIEYHPDQSFVDRLGPKSQEINLTRNIGFILAVWSKSEVMVQPIQKKLNMSTVVNDRSDSSFVLISDIINNYRIPDTWIEYKHGYVVNNPWLLREYTFDSSNYFIIVGSVIYQIRESEALFGMFSYLSNKDIQDGPIYDFRDHDGCIALKCSSDCLDYSREMIEYDVNNSIKMHVIDTFHALNFDLIEKLYDIEKDNREQKFSTTELFTKVENAGFPIYGECSLPHWMKYVGDEMWDNPEHRPSFKTVPGIIRQSKNKFFIEYTPFGIVKDFHTVAKRTNIILYKYDITKRKSFSKIDDKLKDISKAINDNIKRKDFDKFVEDSNIREFLKSKSNIPFLIIQKGKDNFDDFPAQYVKTVIDYDDILKAHKLLSGNDAKDGNNTDV